MKLGMINDVCGNSFKIVADKESDFAEFCINAGYDTEDFFKQLPQIKDWIGKYHVSVESIGRWKAFIIDENGNIRDEEINLVYKLIDASEYLGCTNYVCGCNYVDKLSYYEN